MKKCVDTFSCTDEVIDTNICVSLLPIGRQYMECTDDWNIPLPDTPT